jgi:hypothetical protein
MCVSVCACICVSVCMRVYLFMRVYVCVCVRVSGGGHLENSSKILVSVFCNNLNFTSISSHFRTETAWSCTVHVWCSESHVHVLDLALSSLSKDARVTSPS